MTGDLPVKELPPLNTEIEVDNRALVSATHHCHACDNGEYYTTSDNGLVRTYVRVGGVAFNLCARCVKQLRDMLHNSL